MTKGIGYKDSTIKVTLVCHSCDQSQKDMLPSPQCLTPCETLTEFYKFVDKLYKIDEKRIGSAANLKLR